MQIKLEEVKEAIDSTDVNTQYYYYIPEERIIIKDDDSIKDKYLIPLPSHKQIDDYGTMKNFIAEKTDGEAKEWLEECIRGAGAFRRFRSTLERFALSEKWYEYLDEAHEDIAIDWCEYYGIEYLEDTPFQKAAVSPAATPASRPDARHNYRFITIDKDNVYSLAYLVVDYRKTLSSYKYQPPIDVDEAVEELRYYLNKSYPIFAVSDNGRYVGFGVCRIEDDVVWLEAIYVRPEYRKKGIGKMLFEKAESIAKEYGNETLYQYVHPNNDRMIGFLDHLGYNVLNLIEIRKAYPEEETKQTYTIGEHEYRY